MEDIHKIREQFPITKHRTFLNHAAQSPPPKPAVDAVRKYVTATSRFGPALTEWDDKGKPFFGKLICAKPEEIAVVENTSTGLNVAANALHYPHGSKIVTTDLEYVSVTYPWLRERLGVKIHYVKNVNGKVMLDDMEKAVDDKTVALAVSHVEYSNGFRHNLKVLSEIAHEHGAHLIVDAIQSAGTMPIDVKRDDIDFLTAGCYKWLLSPLGAGYLYVKSELISKLEPTFVGWASVDQKVFDTVDFWNIWDMKLSETASRFEIGSPSFSSLVGARESMKLLLDYGLENINKRILKLTDRLIESTRDLGLELATPEEKTCRSGIVNFKMDNAQEIEEKLGKKGIIVSARSRGIRVSPHYYNTEEEIDKLMNEVKRFC